MSALAPFAAPGELDTADRLGRLADSLLAPRDAIDGAFVSVGGRLADCAAILAHLTQTFEELPAELESGELAEATERLAVVSRRAREISQVLAAEQVDLTRLVQVVAHAQHPIDELRRAVKMMNIVAVNARVVAAGIIAEMDDFEVFTTDIARLSDTAAQTIATFSRTYVALVGVVGVAAETRSRFEATHRDTLSVLAAELETSLTEVTRQRLDAIESSAVTGRMSREITERVAATVMALQVGDATRQRIEHVEAALRELADVGTDRALVAPIAELQRRQLASTREALVEQMASGEQALRALARDAVAVLEHAREVYGENDDRSALSRLRDAVRDAVQVLRDCEAEREQLNKVAAAVADSVKVLLDHVEAVQDIEAKMRLVSLNAAVKCAQLGPRGRALDVISQQLRALTGETVNSAHEAVGRLSEAASLAEAFISSAGCEAGRVGDLECEATAALVLLETVGDRMKKALTNLYRDGPIVAQHLDEAVEDLSHHGAISEALRDVEFTVASLAPSSPGARHMAPGNEALVGLLAMCRRRCTMDIERRIHDGFVGTPPNEEPVVPATGDAGSIDDLLF